MKLVRWVLKHIILTLNALFPPKGVVRDPAVQAEIQKKAQSMSLYQFDGCPFCVKVRRAMKRQSVEIELRDAKNNAGYRSDLQANGGKVKVPCLRIDHAEKTEWLYESSAIVAFLEKEFA